MMLSSVSAHSHQNMECPMMADESINQDTSLFSYMQQ
jgi:hypothetical protein